VKMRRAETGVPGDARKIGPFAPVRVQIGQGAGDMLIVCCLIRHISSLAPPGPRATRILRKGGMMQGVTNTDNEIKRL